MEDGGWQKAFASLPSSILHRPSSYSRSVSGVEFPELHVARADRLAPSREDLPYGFGRSDQSAGDARDRQVAEALGHLQERDARQDLDRIGLRFVDHRKSALDRPAVLKEQPHHAHF